MGSFYSLQGLGTVAFCNPQILGKKQNTLNLAEWNYLQLPVLDVKANLAATDSAYFLASALSLNETVMDNIGIRNIASSAKDVSSPSKDEKSVLSSTFETLA